MSWRQTLSFLRLTDDDNVLSITNIGMWVALTRLACVQNATVPDLVAALIAFTAYGYKKHLASKEPPEAPIVDLSPTLEKLNALESNLKITDDALSRAQTEIANLKSASAIKALAGR